MELVRREFVIELDRESDRVVARDTAGAILVMGATTSEVVSRLQALVCGPMGQLVPWSAVLRFRPDGRVGLTGMYRVMKADRANAARNRLQPA